MFLGDKEDNEWRMMLHMIDGSELLVWITGGSLLHGRSPEFGISQGLSRSVAIEQPSLSIRHVDIDLERDQIDSSVSHIMTLLAAEHSNTHDRRLQNEREFLTSGGLVYTARIAPCQRENDVF